MRKNMSTSDRGLRLLIAAGAVAGSGVLGFTTAWGIVLLVVAAIMIVTSMSGYCPLYSLLHTKTLRAGNAEPGDRHISHLHQAA